MNLNRIKKIIETINRINHKKYKEIQDPKTESDKAFNMLLRYVNECSKILEDVYSDTEQYQKIFELKENKLCVDGLEREFLIDDPIELLNALNK